MKLSAKESSRFAGRVEGTFHMAGGFGVIIRGDYVAGGGFNAIAWSWSDSPETVHSSTIWSRFCPDHGRLRHRFRAGKTWVYLDECERA